MKTIIKGQTKMKTKKEKKGRNNLLIANTAGVGHLLSQFKYNKIARTKYNYTFIIFKQLLLCVFLFFFIFVSSRRDCVCTYKVRVAARRRYAKKEMCSKTERWFNMCTFGTRESFTVY